MSGSHAQRSPGAAVLVNGVQSGGGMRGNHHAVNGNHAPATPQLPPPHYPAHFVKGSVIQLANGELKRVEDLKTEDFIRSAEISDDLCLDSSTVLSLTPLPDRGTIMLEFSIGHQNLRVSVESTMEHPFFVYNHGWSSYSPARTLQRYDLPCSQLEVGDQCISLTQKTPVALAATRTDTKPVGTTSGSFSSSSFKPAASRIVGRTRLASDSSVFQFHGK